jgi:hypothetical protein
VKVAVPNGVAVYVGVVSGGGDGVGLAVGGGGVLDGVAVPGGDTVSLELGAEEGVGVDGVGASSVAVLVGVAVGSNVASCTSRVKSAAETRSSPLASAQGQSLSSKTARASAARSRSSITRSQFASPGTSWQD